MIFSALVKLAALIVLLMLGGIIVSLIISSRPSIQKFGFAFLWTKEWDAPNGSSARWSRLRNHWSPLLSRC